MSHPNWSQEGILERVSPEPNTGCWLWDGALNNGYGHMTVRNKQVGAHRVSYMAFKGPIPKGLDLDHLCRVPCCVNPDHLEPVTRQVNVLRGNTPKVSALRMTQKTHCPQGHPYSGDNLAIDAEGARRCLICKRDACNRAAKKRRAKEKSLVHP